MDAEIAGNRGRLGRAVGERIEDPELRVATTTARATITAWRVSTTGVGARPAKVAIRSSSVSGIAPTRIAAPRPR